MDRTEQPARAADTSVTLTAPTGREICSQFLNEHGDYDDWSAETVQAYQATIHHAAAYGTA